MSFRLAPGRGFLSATSCGHVLLGWFGLVTVCAGPVWGEQRVPVIERDEFTRLHKMIRPFSGESPWREIDWLTNITEARRRAVAEDKPIVIFTAADGSPLGRT